MLTTVKILSVQFEDDVGRHDPGGAFLRGFRRDAHIGMGFAVIDAYDRDDRPDANKTDSNLEKRGKAGFQRESLAESDKSRAHRLSAAALTGLMEEVCVAAMSEDTGAGQYAVTNVMHFRNLVPTRTKDEIRATATFRMFDGDLYWFDVVVTGADGPVATGSHGLSIVDRRESDA